MIKHKKKSLVELLDRQIMLSVKTSRSRASIIKHALWFDAKKKKVKNPSFIGQKTQL